MIQYFKYYKLYSGWRRIRFIADNPGAWAFHCHITAHFLMGMGTAFLISQEKIPKPPPHFYSEPSTSSSKAYYPFLLLICIWFLI